MPQIIHRSYTSSMFVTGDEGSLQGERDRAVLMPQTIHRSYTSSMFGTGGEGPHKAEPDRAPSGRAEGGRV